MWTSRALRTTGVSFKVGQNGPLNNRTLDELADDDDDIDLEDFRLPVATDFDDFRATAEKLENHNIYKQLTKEGYGTEKLSSLNAHVVYHYSFFLDGQIQPFDSTYVRNRAEVLEDCDNASVLPGVMVALQTMKAGEKADFLIDYRLMYGDFGCMARVPPKADIFVSLELLRFNETGDADALKQLDSTDCHKFKVVIVKATEVYKKALDSFKHNRCGAANREFDTAIKALEFCRLNDASEQNEQHEFLVKMYRNQAVVYNKVHNWKKTCLMCQELLRIGKTYVSYDVAKDCKAQFLWGRALLELGEFKRGREHLMRAVSLEPTNQEIRNELLRLSTVEQKKHKNDIEFARRALNAINIREEKEDEVEQPEETNNIDNDDGEDNNNAAEDESFMAFQETIRSILINFVESANHMIVLPHEMSDLEVVQVREMAEDFGLFFKHRSAQNGTVEFFLLKQ